MNRRWPPNRITDASESSGELPSSMELGERLPRLNTREPLGRGPWLFYAGIYAATVKYFEQDVVKSGSSFYVCIKAHGPNPDDHAVSNATYWLLWSAGGGGGGNMNFRGEFNPVETYAVGDVVLLRVAWVQGLYWCSVATTGGLNSPFGDPSRGETWVQLAPGTNLGNWF